MVMSVVFIDELDAKVFNYEHKLEGSPLVVPNARSGGGLIIASCVAALFKELVSKDSGPQQIINAVTNFKRNPVMVYKLEEIILLDDFFPEC